MVVVTQKENLGRSWKELVGICLCRLSESYTLANFLGHVGTQLETLLRHLQLSGSRSQVKGVCKTPPGLEKKDKQKHYT